MKANLRWTQGMQFEAFSGENKINVDAKPPIGKGSGMTPKELVLVGVGGCTAMDVIGYLRKFKQVVESLDVEVETQTSQSGHPAVFTEGVILFSAKGNIDATILNEGVRLSQTKYCGVSAMLSKAFPIKYVVKLNDQQIAEGYAHF